MYKVTEEDELGENWISAVYVCEREFEAVNKNRHLSSPDEFLIQFYLSP